MPVNFGGLAGAMMDTATPGGSSMIPGVPPGRGPLTGPPMGGGAPPPGPAPTTPTPGGGGPQQIIQQIAAAIQQMTGRPATQQEIMQVLSQMQGAGGGMPGIAPGGPPGPGPGGPPMPSPGGPPPPVMGGAPPLPPSTSGLIRR